MTKKYCTNDFYQKTRYLNIVKDYLSADTFMTLYHTILYPFYTGFVPLFLKFNDKFQNLLLLKKSQKMVRCRFSNFFRFFRYQSDS